MSCSPPSAKSSMPITSRLSADDPARWYALGMAAGYSVAITVADVDPLPAVTGPFLAPAPIPVGRIVVKERCCTNERKVAETMVMPESEVVESVESVDVVESIEVVESVDENLPAGEGCADKAVSTRYGYTPAGDHASAEAAATETHSTTTKAGVEMRSATTEPTVHATATEPTAAVHATAATTAAAGHGRRRNGDCYPQRGRGKATN